MLFVPSRAFPRLIRPCLPMVAAAPPVDPDWIHEIKHNGFRLIARRDGKRVRLLTRNGYNWANRFPLIVEAVRALRAASCLIDGEAIICDGDGLADFERLRSRRHDDEAVLCAFDLIELDGRDLRREPIEERKAALAKLLRRCGPGLVLNVVFEQPGDVVFKHARALGCEGIVSKRRGSPYVSGRSRHWVKVKDPAAPAVRREEEEDWS
jgi:bifunctional non-homologous end joining protein LigD